MFQRRFVFADRILVAVLGRIESSAQGIDAIMVWIERCGPVQKGRGFVELTGVEHGLRGTQLYLDVSRRPVCCRGIGPGSSARVTGERIGISQFLERTQVFLGQVFEDADGGLVLAGIAVVRCDRSQDLGISRGCLACAIEHLVCLLTISDSLVRTSQEKFRSRRCLHSFGALQIVKGLFRIVG